MPRDGSAGVKRRVELTRGDSSEREVHAATARARE
jgi:hypothetical protein